ncbi:MAG: hypothetical protein ACREAZ_07690 [Nitrososphaera sp.]
MAIETEVALWIEIGSLLVETAIVVLLIKTVRDYADVARMSRLQIEQRFRPWIGPTSGIELLRTTEQKHQFSIAIKNFGEIPATNVIAESTIKSELPSKDVLKENGTQKFVLGPLLPNMEKRYWIFVDSEQLNKAKEGTSDLFTFVHFTYEYHGGKSGYGMISQFDPKSGTFVHKEMWVG